MINIYSQYLPQSASSTQMAIIKSYLVGSEQNHFHSQFFFSIILHIFWQICTHNL